MLVLVLVQHMAAPAELLVEQALSVVVVCKVMDAAVDMVQVGVVFVDIVVLQFWVRDVLYVRQAANNANI